jgi:hypothetical protein
VRREGRPLAADNEVRAGHGVADRVPGQPGQANVHLLYQELNLPGEKHSYGLGSLVAVEAPHGS